MNINFVFMLPFRLSGEIFQILLREKRVLQITLDNYFRLSTNSDTSIQILCLTKEIKQNHSVSILFVT